jgi:hypothetical protein
MDLLIKAKPIKKNTLFFCEHRGTFKLNKYEGNIATCLDGSLLIEINKDKYLIDSKEVIQAVINHKNQTNETKNK